MGDTDGDPPGDTLGRGMLTVQQVAEYMQVSTETVRRWLRSGQLPGFNVGGTGGWRVKREDLDTFIASKRARP